MAKKPKSDKMTRVRTIQLGHGKTARIFAVTRGKGKTVGYVVKVVGRENARKPVDNH